MNNYWIVAEVELLIYIVKFLIRVMRPELFLQPFEKKITSVIIKNVRISNWP